MTDGTTYAPSVVRLSTREGRLNACSRRSGAPRQGSRPHSRFRDDHGAATMAIVVEGRDPWSGRSLRVTADGGRIESIESVDRALDLWLAPGLVDLQVNGFAGHDLNAGNVDPSTVVELVRSLAQVGVTTFAPTIITAPEQQIIAALTVVAAARAADPMVARAVPFVHL